jgi:uncharacterized protein YkwD
MPKSRARKGRKPYRPRPGAGSGAAMAIRRDAATGLGDAAGPRPGDAAGLGPGRLPALAASPASAVLPRARSGPDPAGAPGRPGTQDMAAFQRRVIGSDAWLRVIEDRVVLIVNDERRKRGLPPLRHDDRLRRSARAHSADMAARGYFAHVAPDGKAPGDWMREAGYHSPAGENIARGQPDPPQVMMTWMNSPPHRAGIMDPAARAIGVGVHHGPSGPWWTQHFGWR